MATAQADYQWSAVRRWLAERADQPVVVLCAEMPHDVAERRLAVQLESCVADLPAYRLIDLVVASGQSIIVCRKGCTSESTPPIVAEVVDLLGDEQASVAATVEPGPRGPVLDVVHPPVRRRLFGRPVDDPVVHQATSDQGRLVESLRLAKVADAPGVSAAAALTATECTACGLCVRTCPHDALELVEMSATLVGDVPVQHELTTALVHHPDRCEADGMCVLVCPVKGLAFSEHLPWPEVLSGERRVLLTMATAHCARCGAQTTWTPSGSVDDEVLCEGCQWRRQNPFGMKIPRFMQHKVNLPPA